MITIEAENNSDQVIAGDNCKYHCKMIPAIKGGSRRMKGARFQKWTTGRGIPAKNEICPFFQWEKKLFQEFFDIGYLSDVIYIMLNEAV